MRSIDEHTGTRRPSFEFFAGPYRSGELLVISFEGKEAASKPFSFDITIAARSSGALVDEILGARAILALNGDDDHGRRAISGIVARVAPEGAVTVDERRLYRVRLVPALWLLGRRKTSRVFQGMSVPEIIDAVLQKAAIDRSWRLSREYPKRDYCVQYQETDLRFVSRLLAEEGIFYFITQPNGDREDQAEIVVFADAAAHYEPIVGEPRLPCRDAGAMTAGEQIHRFTLEHGVHTGETTLTAFDFKRPAFALRADARAERGRGALDQAALSAYEHDGDVAERNIDGQGARVRLEQQRVKAQIGQGESSCRRLVPGAWFELEEHTEPELCQRYAVVSVEHRGRAPGAPGQDIEVYTNRFRCLPSSVPCRPRRVARKLQQVTETATVVGPPGEEIHTDEHGRIKVQFHWDLEGKRDDKSSCWLRTMQPWAGSAWGFQFIPRVGMEVVVTFVGGDIDRPMVLGALYNGTNPTPYPLPLNKTQSGIRTRSSPGGAGANELRFEDAAAQEHIYLHAQRDFEEVVENDHVRTVHGNEVVSIGKHFIMHVTGKQIIHVDGNAAAGEAGETAPVEAGGESRAADQAESGPGAVVAAPPDRSIESDGLRDAAARRGAVLGARMLWMVEQLPADLYARGERMRDGIARAREQLAQVLEAARAVAPAVDVRARAQEAKQLISGLLVTAIEPGEPGFHRVQVESIEQLRGLAREADEMERAVLLAGAPDGDEGGGRGRGGGGARISDWSNKGDESKMSELNIKGGGIINSPDALTLVGKDGSIDIQGGTMTLRATTIVLEAKNIKIIGQGETKVEGHPIRLN